MPKSDRRDIVLIVGGLACGGLERQVSYLAPRLKDYGVTVVVWSYREEDRYVNDLRRARVEIVGIEPDMAPWRKLVWFRQLIGKVQPGVIHSYSYHTNFAAWFAALNRTVTSVGSLRNDFTSELRDAGKVLGRMSARWPRVHIANNLAARDAALSHPGPFHPARVEVVRNGLDLDRFAFSAQLPAEVRMLGVGSHTSRKRWDRLIRAAAVLRAEGREFAVTLVGSGPLTDELRNLAKDLNVDQVISFLGERSDIPELLAQSSFLVLTSDHEGCPNVVMEAMACGRAVVTTDAGDCSVLVDYGRTGFVVPCGDDQALVDALRQMLNTRQSLVKMGDSARMKAEQCFGLDRLVRETLAAYRGAGWKGRA